MVGENAHISYTAETAHPFHDHTAAFVRRLHQTSSMLPVYHKVLATIKIIQLQSTWFHKCHYATTYIAKKKKSLLKTLFIAVRTRELAPKPETNVG